MDMKRKYQRKYDFELNKFDWINRLWIGIIFLFNNSQLLTLRSDYYQKYEDLKYSHTRNFTTKVTVSLDNSQKSFYKEEKALLISSCSWIFYFVVKRKIKNAWEK